MARGAAGPRVKLLGWFALEEPRPSKPKVAAPTAEPRKSQFGECENPHPSQKALRMGHPPSKSLLGELARWYHRSAAADVTRGKHVARRAPPAMD